MASRRSASCEEEETGGYGVEEEEEEEEDEKVEEEEEVCGVPRTRHREMHLYLLHHRPHSSLLRIPNPASV